HAAIGGRTAVINLLLERGVDVNSSHLIQALIMVTPLCAARLRGRKETETLLVERGAREDVFTHALLGDINSLEEDLANEQAAAQASDPAVDALEITPLHHAVAGEQLQAVRLLLAHAEGSLVGVRRALREAVAREHVPIVRL